MLPTWNIKTIRTQRSVWNDSCIKQPSCVPCSVDLDMINPYQSCNSQSKLYMIYILFITFSFPALLGSYCSMKDLVI